MKKLIKTHLEIVPLQLAVTSYLETNNPAQVQAWQTFCDALKQLPTQDKVNLDKTERLWLLQTMAQCLATMPTPSSKLATIAHLALYLKVLYGARITRLLFTLDLAPADYHLEHFTEMGQLLIELAEQPKIITALTSHLPNLSAALDFLKEQQAQLWAKQQPSRHIDALLERFQSQDELTQFPLSVDELAQLKPSFIAVQGLLSHYRELSLDSLKTIALEQGPQVDSSSEAKQQLLAVLIELIRRHRKIVMHDTQILALLALLNTPKNLKGRIAQIKTGEGKTILIAVLAAFKACQGKFVDVLTPSDYLAIRDAEINRPFFEALDLSVGHICHQEPKQAHFHAQILYGTSTDFKFSLLRDGLYHSQLRKSYRKGVLVDRTCEVAIPDESDSLCLDDAANSALLSMLSDENVTWVYDLLLEFARQHPGVTDPALFVQQQESLAQFPSKRVKRWLISANKALYQEQAKQSYFIKTLTEQTAKGTQQVERIVISDYQNTGRSCEGSEWQHGLHQCLQTKEKVPLTPEALTAASMAHFTFFSQYSEILGLTGTMGEYSEREEMKLYQVDTFDVPPHFPCKRLSTASKLTANADLHKAEIVKNTLAIRQAGRPQLILVDSIKASEELSAFLATQGVSHQVLNTIQAESEDYIIARAGEAGQVTVATNVAGRGTDILLSPAAKAAGGLHVTFTAYPKKSLRVQLQGIGRAGRQNQPGSWNMILNMEEIGIPDLPWQDIPAEPVLQLLHEQRSQRIHAEAARRYQCAQQETIFYKKLSSFFKDLQAVHVVFESEAFKTKFIALCTTLALDAEADCLECNADWQPLLTLCQTLLEKQQSQVKVDWSSFYTQFKTTYIKTIQKNWAVFYNQMHDDIAYEGEENIQEQVDAAYEQLKDSFEPLLTEVENTALHLLEEILSTAHVAWMQGEARNPGFQPGFS